jgi:hypothetical protein
MPKVLKDEDANKAAIIATDWFGSAFKTKTAPSFEDAVLFQLPL